jgi:methanogenic corrinoid protein MtbC1
LTNHINPAQEHLVTNIIRQKLIVGIDKVVQPADSLKSVLLFLPEGEYHELGLLYMHYILKERGIKTIYIGAAAPIKDIVYVTHLLQPDFMYTHLTTVAKNFHFDRFMEQIHLRLPNTPLIVSGQSTASSWQNLFLPPYISKNRMS